MRVDSFLRNKLAVDQNLSFRGIFRIAFLLMAVFVYGTAASAADPIVITSNTTISASDMSYDTLSITVDACTVTINGAHQFDNLSLVNGAKITHSSNSSSQINILDLSITNDLTIDGTSLVDVNGRGYARDQGAGKGVSGFYGGGGGGHGGNGGNSSSGSGGASYDSVTNPSQIGSGGGRPTGAGAYGGSGGGGIRLNVGGRIQNNGAIRAGGNNGTSYSSSYSAGGGSGGFIHLTVGELAGSGTISANGGNGGHTSSGGGGAGGRIAIFYDTNAYTGAVTAYGGTGKQYGAAGSISFKSNTSVEVQVIYDNNGNSGASTNVSGILPDVVIRNKAVVVAVNELTAEDCTIDNAYFYANSKSAFENLVIMSDGFLSHSSNSSSQAYIIDMDVSGSITIEAGGYIDVNGRGYAGDKGAGKGVSGYYGGGGGGHGGNGGNGSSGSGGAGYDSVTNPSQIGSGGGKCTGASGAIGGSGGGGIRLNVGGRLENNGAIQAAGNNGTSYSSSYSGGGGSGGFIHLTVGELAGSGTISANGGNGGHASSGGGGAGGRIALYYTGKHPATTYNISNISVSGGAGKYNGQNGTLYIPEVGNPVIATNNGTDFITDTANITLEGTCLPDADLILINGSSDGVDHASGDPAWSYSLTLQEGINTFEVVSQNELGNQSGATTITIILDTTPAGAPVITTNTGGDFTVQNHHVVFQGSCSSDTVQILVNGSSNGVTFTPGSTTWTYEGELAVGVNNFTVVAIDAAGHESPADTITINFDNTIPDRPSNQSPTDAGIDVDLQTTLIASVFSDQDSDDHLSSQWQIRTASGAYDAPIFDSGEDIQHLTQLAVPEGLLEWTTEYFWRVRYRDSRGSWSVFSDETSFMTVSDNSPPENIVNLSVAESTETGLTFAWDHSANTAGDLAGYMVYFNGDTQGSPVAPDQNEYAEANLSPSTGYTLRVTALDDSGNESGGVSITGVTLLDNPAITTISPRAGGVKLFWDAAEPSEYVMQYRVYMSESDFSSVEGMIPKVTTTSLSAAVTGLAGGVNYYFAVSAVNISDGEQKVVHIVSATPITGTNVSGAITQNTTWTLAGSPFIVTGDVTVQYSSHNSATATLAIEPGVEVRFDPGTGLYIGNYRYYYGARHHYGALSAQGTIASPVTFTSNATTPSPGDWKGIYFRDQTNDSLTLLDHCIVEYGGHTNDANLYFAKNKAAVKNSKIRFSNGHGIYLAESSSDIISNNISENAENGIYSDNNSSSQVKDNIFTENGQSAVNIYPNGVKHLSGNSGTGNGNDYIAVQGGDLTSDGTWVKQPFPYVITGDVTVRYSSYNSATATLTIEPGVEVRFEPGTGLYIGYYEYYYGARHYYGALSAQGTIESPITFTSNAATPSPGDWKGIYFRNQTNDGLALLEHCIVEYGGSAHSANLYFASASPTVKNSTIRYSSGHGIYSDDASSGYINDNTFSDNAINSVSVHPVRVIARISGNSGSGGSANYISVRGGLITSDNTWSKNKLSYVIAGDITVRYSTHNSATATLTIEPGVEVRFEPGTGLYIGYYQYYYGARHHYGALSAQGTIESPITFTSNAAVPSPGDWKGIYFRDQTNDSLTLLEHCIVEYGGHTNDANLYFAKNKAAVKNSKIRFSNGHGIYLAESSSDIISNNISENAENGIYSDNNSSSQVKDNIFTENGQSAVNIYPNGVKHLSGNSGTGNGNDYIAVQGGDLTSDGTWVKQPFPYVITGDVTVRYSSYNSATATLTIEPGVEVRFEPGTGLYIGYYQYYYGARYYYGALSAQGTIESPITFTSNAAVPSPGDWKGIYFRNETHDAFSMMEHCTVEYGGQTNNADIYLANAKPTIQYNTIRNSSHSGIIVNNTGSNDAVINCNNFKDNLYGVYTINNAQPVISQNNFLRNQNYGLYNTGSSVNAVNNWWGDTNGPNTNGDATYGNMVYTPWLVAESDCINTPPTNSPPFAPRNPSPSNGAVRVPVLNEGLPLDVTLGWAGGDPNPWDTVVYDVYLGTDPDNLPLVAANHPASDYAASDLDEGTTYYWKIVSRDNGVGGLETTGPVWHYTTLGAPPDLIISNVTWNPASDLQAGQTITFTATVENTGSGPVVDAFKVELYVDGSNIGSKTVHPVMPENTSLPLSFSWTAVTGNHTIEVRADSQNKVIELYEENNSRSVDLPYIKDPTPPDIVSMVPTGGASLKQVNTIVFTLNDQFGVVDDAAVSASVAVLDSSGQPVAGSITESFDRFVFTPATVPLADDVYRVSLTAQDLAGNAQEFTFSFTVDGQPPAAPVITGGAVSSGLVGVRPVVNQSKTATVILTGNREDNTAVYINDQKKIDRDSGNWSAQLNLAQGDNALEVRLQDAAGNSSPSVWVDIRVDSVAPAVTGITPANSSFINTAPSVVNVSFTETTSGLSLDRSTLSIQDGGQQPVDGAWTVSGSSQLVFTPAAGLTDSDYTVSLVLEDEFGNRSAAKTYHFTLDTTSPEAPVVNPISSPTHKPTQQISGTREADAALLLNGSQIVGHTASIDWSHTANLNAGDNSFTFVAQDRAGNQSDPVTVAIFFDDTPPPAVTTLTLDTVGDGRTIKLDWTGYNEAVHGDVASYRIYRSTDVFADVSAASQIGNPGAGNYQFTADDLTRNTTYWFAVVAVDARGNARTAVEPVSGQPQDIIPPENVTHLKVQSFSDRLIFTWDGPAGTPDDLAGYRVLFADSETAELGEDEKSFTKDGLTAASGYSFKIIAIDNDNNESSGQTITGVTLLANPENLTAEVHSGYVDLNWDGAAPSQYVKHYAVYASESDFASVAGMTPTLTPTGTTAKVAGLTNDVTYYFAVTTVNTSDGEDPDVTTITAKPEADSAGPEIGDIEVDEQPLADGATVIKPVTFSCEAQDPAGVSRVEYFIDGSLVRTDYAAPYTCFWNVVEAEDGARTLTIEAYDTLGNRTTETYSLNVLLARPAAPQITEPAGGIITNTPTITVTGQAEKFSEVALYNNDIATGVVVAVDALGNFSTPLTLAEGQNRLQAAASNRAGEGPKSAEVPVNLDTTLPVSPSNLAAQARSAGAVRLTWTAPADIEVAGYNLYRASGPFTTPQGAGKLNTDLIQNTAFDDLPPSDGTWYYRVSTVDGADNESDLSDQASANADGTPPRASAIDYSPQGAFDDQTGTMAPGTVNVVLTINEPLQSDPYLSIAPDGGIPLAVQLSKDTDTTYSGFFVISDSTPNGTAYAIFSARDAVGNRGTEIDAGSTIRIDTDGPSVTRVVVTPPAPIANDEDSPVSVTVILGLDEKIKPNEFPQLSYRLSGAQRDAIAIDSLTELAAQAPDVQTWQAQFDLPADAGLAAAETFYFIYQGRDALDNVGDRIQAPNIFQVYQGDLPPLAAPLEFKAQTLSGGRIRLTWLAVEQAVGYQLYRKSPGESELTAYARLDAVQAFEDAPAQDGSYTYTVASIRRENDQEALSGLSSQLVVNADAQAPGAPSSLALELVANGIKITWQPPAYTEDIAYALYRSDQQILSVDGLVPLATDIGQTLVVDPTPSLSDHWYAVTGVDAAGNESLPSNAEYLNIQLLPVSGITVVLADDQPPVVSWTHPGGDIAGYDVYLGPDDAAVKLNAGLLTGKTYTDTGYSGDERRYTIVTVDNSDAESLGRSLTLPVLRAVLSDGSRIERGIMNRLDYAVSNAGESRVDNIRLKVRVGSHDHTSEPISLDPGTSRTIPVVVGGYDDLQEELAALTTTIEVVPRANELVQNIRSGQIEVADGMLRLQILNEEFTRAGAGQVQFVLENTGEEQIEIVTAKNSGNSASDQITFYLVDEDDNVLSSRFFKQATGAKAVTLSNKNTVVRIAAGESFTSDPTSLPVPANAPDDVIVRLEIDHVYYHQGQATQVKMNGPATTHALTLVDTAYYGELLDITPQSATGDQDIVITGRAVERAGGQAMTHVPLSLVITLDGFERTYDVFAGDDGQFTYRFKPLAGESGIYRVRAVHPDRTDKSVHGQFVIDKVAVTPAVLNLNAPKNYTNTIKIRVQTGDGTTVNDLRLEYAATDQPTGEKPAGVHLTPGEPIASLSGNQTAYLPFTIWADNTAGATEKLKLTVKSGDADPIVWGTVSINAQFSEAKPSLYFSPNHVETGVARDNTVSEVVRLENKCLAELYNVRLSLLDAAKNPAPSWIYLNSAAAVGNLAIGATKPVGIAFSPTAAVAEGDHAFYLRVAADNHPTTDIHLYVAVTQEGQGSALFKVSDIYTGTLGESGEIIQGLAGARVKLQNESILTEEYIKLTDNLGEAWFENIPAGRYKCRITAKNHQEYIGRVWIKPGVTTTEDVFLDYNLVTVEWSVTEITIQDKYDIVLTAVYETNVPAAVVVIEPASVTLPAMQAGDVFNGEFTLTNYGLIRADDLSLSLPPDDQYFKYEALAALPDSLAAKQRITVPYRVTCLKSLEPDADGQATGGGCGGYRTCSQVGYGYYCANGVWTRSAVRHCWTRGWGSCSGGAGNRRVTWIGIGDFSRGSVSMPAARPTSIEGPKCFREPPRTEQDCGDEDRCSQKDTSDNRSQPTGSSVNMVMREYTRDQVDLAVKVPGGTIRAKRWFYDNQWFWEHDRNRLKLQPASIGGGIESIDKGGVVYEKSSLEADVFINEIFRIIKTDTGYRWQDPKGGWIDYDADGNMTARGNRTGVQVRLLYQDDKLTGAADRNDNQVLWYETDDDGLITAVSDSDNRRVAYTYANGRLSSATDVLGFVTGFGYDSQGRLETIVEPAGRTITVSYEQYNGVASVVDSRGEGYFFDYDYNEATGEQYARVESSAGKIKEVWYDRDFEIRQVDINGRTVKQIAKDGRNLLVTDEQGNITRKYYDEWDNLTKVIYPDGSSVSYKYEHRYNRRVEEIDENEVITRYAYDDSGNLTRKLEAAGTEYERITEYTYDGDGNLLTNSRLADANTAEALTLLAYDDLGNLTSITDPEGGITRFTSHDAMGNVLSKIDARGKLWKYEYDAAGNLRKVIDPLGYGPEFFYDEMGKKTKEIDANNNEKFYDYNEKNNLTRVTDDLGNSTRFEYDPDGKLLRQVDAEGKTINYEYDPDGRLVKTIDGNGNQIDMEYADAGGSGCSSCAAAGGASNQPSRISYPTFAKEFLYDKRGRKTVEKDVLSASEVYLTDFDYDPAGNLIARTDKEEKTTGYAYDELNRLKTVTDPLNQDTAYFYDNRDNLTALTDAEGNTTWFEYDRNNRLIKETRPEGQQTAYDYDDAGNLIEKIDAKNQKTEYGYDDAGRLTDIRYFAAADDVNPSKTVSFSYDDAGNLTGYDDGFTSAVYAYDDLYRKLSEKVNYGTFELTNSYTYYKNGLKKTFTDPDGVTYTYTYDDNNQLTGVNIPGAGYITYSAYQWNRPTEVILPGGGKREYAYGPLMRVKSISAKDPAQNILLNYQYDYDKVDNITAKVTEHGEYGYGYDDLYRLTDADNPVQADEGFSYDAVGNRLTAEGVTGDWGYNDNNELQGYDGVAFSYDSNGNMTQKIDAGQVTSYIYNVEDRLQEVRDGSGSLISTYYYDPFGRRLWKEVGGVKTYFVYADEGLVAEVDATGNVTKSYGYRPGSTWTTDPLFMKVGGQYYFYQNDHLGTPQKLTAVNGAVVWTAKYSSFGDASVDISSLVTNNLRYAGQYFDAETGLHYNYKRYYDPVIGRYLRVDPIGFGSGDVNLYSYVYNRPLNFVDPEGEIALPILFVVSVLYVAAVIYVQQHPVDIPAYPSSDDDEVVVPLPTDKVKPRDGTKDRSRADDDECKRNQALLNQERNENIDALYEECTRANDPESIIYIRNKISIFNDRVDLHNKYCPRFPVLPITL